MWAPLGSRVADPRSFDRLGAGSQSCRECLLRLISRGSGGLNPAKQGSLKIYQLSSFVQGERRPEEKEVCDARP
jgi:hypothetical protein